MGILWEFFGTILGMIYRLFIGVKLGILWDIIGNKMRLYWEQGFLEEYFEKINIKTVHLKIIV